MKVDPDSSLTPFFPLPSAGGHAHVLQYREDRQGAQERRGHLRGRRQEQGGRGNQHPRPQRHRQEEHHSRQEGRPSGRRQATHADHVQGTYSMMYERSETLPRLSLVHAEMKCKG